jgi:hypothetical protein
MRHATAAGAQVLVGARRVAGATSALARSRHDATRALGGHARSGYGRAAPVIAVAADDGDGDAGSPTRYIAPRSSDRST